jgi:transcriptional regulator with XRE-family HTH domain
VITPNKDILDWLSAGLRQPGKTQRGLAHALGVDPASINRLLKGRRKLRVDEIGPAARYLGHEPPSGYATERSASTPAFIDLPAELRVAVFAKAMDLGIEPEEFLARSVRAALMICGPRVGGTRY